MSYCEGLESTGRQLLLLVSDPRRLACPFVFLGSLICKHKVSLEMEAGPGKRAQQEKILFVRKTVNRVWSLDLKRWRKLTSTSYPDLHTGSIAHHMSTHTQNMNPYNEFILHLFYCLFGGGECWGVGLDSLTYSIASNSVFPSQCWACALHLPRVCCLCMTGDLGSWALALVTRPEVTSYAPTKCGHLSSIN